MSDTFVKFSGPGARIKLDFHALPTPMVEYSGTAKELHDIIINYLLKSEPDTEPGPADGHRGGCQ